MLFLSNRYLNLRRMVCNRNVFSTFSSSLLASQQQKYFFTNKAGKHPLPNQPNVAKLEVGEDFEGKSKIKLVNCVNDWNEFQTEFTEKCLKRPISPHLSIYKLQNNMILSMTHRFTGLILFGLPVGLAIVAILLPETYPYYLEMLEGKDMSKFLITPGKFLIALTFSFHFLNGIRHLIWDTGYLFTVKHVDRSGYVVMLLAVILAFHLMCL